MVLPYTYIKCSSNTFLVKSNNNHSKQLKIDKTKEKNLF